VERGSLYNIGGSVTTGLLLFLGGILAAGKVAAGDWKTLKGVTNLF